MRPYQHVHAALGAVRAGCFADAAGEYALASAGYERKGLVATARNYAEMSKTCTQEAARRERQATVSDLIALCRRGAPLPSAVLVQFPERRARA